MHLLWAILRIIFCAIGAIFGSLFSGFLFLPHFGSQASLTLLATINLLIMVLLFRTSDYLTLTIRKAMTLVFVALILFINMSIPNDLFNSFFMRDSAGKPINGIAPNVMESKVREMVSMQNS